MPVTSATSSADIVLNDNDIPPVYLLNDEMHCSVSVWDASGVEVQAAVASPTLKAVEVLNTTVALPRGEKKKICFSLGLPVACQAGEACSFSVLAYDSSDDNSCSAMSLAISGNGTCGCKATPKTENDVTLANGWLPYTPETFCCYVTTKGEFKRTFEAAKALTLKTAYSDSSRAADPHVEGDLTQAVSVAVTDPLAGYSAIPSCKFFSNGYVWTFDNRYISLRGGSMTARYTAYRHTEKNTEIQFSMKQSESNNQAEITSFYLRSGKSIAKIEHSNTVHEAGTKQKSSDGTDKFRFFKQTNNLFALRLPGGTELNTYTESEYGFSLSGVIFASPSDAGKTTGLCGNLDGVPTNDPGDGDITTHIATDDYEDETVRNSLTDWTNASLKCVCTSPYTVSQQICSVQDDEVCSGGLIAPQQGVEYNRELTRRRRSVVEGLDYELFSERGKLSSMLKEMAEAHPIAKRDAASCDTALAAMCSELGNTNLFSTADRDRIVNVQCGGETNTTVDWARLSCTTIQLVAVQHYYRDNMTMVNNPEYQHICVGGCLNNGTCVNGACQCASGFEGDSCHLNITETPVVISEQEVTWNLDPPQCFNITTYDGIGSSATCLVKLFTATIQVDNKITFTQTSFEIVVFLAINTYEGQCCPSSTGRRRRSTGTTNSQYQLQVSNDGQTYSDPIVLTTLDTTCQNITTFPNGTNYVELLSGYCFIDGVCYNESDTNPSLSCQYCTTSYNLFNWNDTCVYNTADNKDDGLPGYAIALIVIAVVAVIVGLAAGVYILVLKKKLYHGIGDIFNRGLVREPTNAKFITVRKDADIAAPWKEPEGVPGMAEPVWQPQQ